MARIFKNMVTAAGVLSVDYIVGGMYEDNGDMLVWTQERAVLRITSLGTLASLTANITAGQGLADEITVSVTVTFDNSTVQYIDITDVLRSVFDRSHRTAMADTATTGMIQLVAYDVDGNIIVVKDMERRISYYDAVVEAVDGKSCGEASGYWLLPDTFRLPDFSNCGGRPQASARMTKGGIFVRILDGGGTVLDIVTASDPTQRTYGWGFDLMQSPAVVEIGNPSMGVVERARIEYVGCSDGWALLTWWSPAIGGWKSCMAEITGYKDEVSESERYIKGFDYAESKGGMFGLQARIPNCTPRDYEYYRDIYYSGIVYMYDESLWVAGQNVQSLEREVMVKGTPPAVKTVGSTDLDFTLLTEEVSSIW